MITNNWSMNYTTATHVNIVSFTFTCVTCFLLFECFFTTSCNIRYSFNCMSASTSICTLPCNNTVQNVCTWINSKDAVG